MPTAAPFDRRKSLDRLGADEFDVLVVGGGITGCGVALDAAARGLRTALIEARDFASGTSSKSSKMVHGGLRYLQQRDYRLVYEALHERQRLLVNAPHLVHPLPFLIPLFGRDGAVAAGLAKAYSLALWTYDLTGGLRIGRRHQRITASSTLAHFPSLRTDSLVAAFLYWDAQTDDARLTLALARTAAAHGAVVANYTPVAELTDTGGRITGARLEDGTVIKAKIVINAGGVWSDQIALLAQGSPTEPVSIRPAKGIHVAVPSEKLPSDYASVLSVPGDKRSVFVVPWAADEVSGPVHPGGYTYIGTTDTDYEGPLDDPECTPEDIDYLLGAVNAWTSAGLTGDDVTGSWAGLRPLISGASSSRTADLSRRHKVITSPNGLITVTGGKLTTYRLMAADTVDVAAKALGRRLPRSPTRRLSLVGSQPPSSRSDDPLTRHLKGRHGSETAEVQALVRENPELAEPLVAGLPYIKAEVVWAARREMAHTLADVMSRRTRAHILNRDAAVAAAPTAARLLAKELGWDESEERAQIAAFEAIAETERRSNAARPEATRPATTRPAAAL